MGVDFQISEQKCERKGKKRKERTAFAATCDLPHLLSFIAVAEEREEEQLLHKGMSHEGEYLAGKTGWAR